jgi:hypothetical protein
MVVEMHRFTPGVQFHQAGAHYIKLWRSVVHSYHTKIQIKLMVVEMHQFMHVIQIIIMSWRSAV